MTWRDRGLVRAANDIDTAARIIEHAYAELDPKDFPLASGLIAACKTTITAAYKELSHLVFEATESPCEPTLEKTSDIGAD